MKWEQTSISNYVHKTFISTAENRTRPQETKI